MEKLSNLLSNFLYWYDFKKLKIVNQFYFLQKEYDFYDLLNISKYIFEKQKTKKQKQTKQNYIYI